MAEYIDREKAIEIIKSGGYWEREDMEVAIAYIEQTPAADVVEVKHGEWENFEIPHMMKCSECGVSDLDIHHSKFIFCPYCGAKMDGKPKERGVEE